MHDEKYYINSKMFLVCSPHEYGRNCAEKCSDHCYDNEICNPFFGNCSKCDDGYQNAKCDESKFLTA